MRHPVLRCIVLALLLTFVGGSSVSAATQTSPQPCPMAMKMAMKADAGAADLMKASTPGKPMPCDHSTPACAKRICCLIGATLPVPLPVVTPVSFGMVQYLPVDTQRDGLSIEPELFPPIHV